jgi:1,4-dihydroxy-2-naphthoyl-CoA hydrolase
MSDSEPKYRGRDGQPVDNPLGAHLHIPTFEPQDGRARVEMEVERIHLRHGGLLHGAVVATLLDTVMGVATYSVAPNRAEVVTMQLNVNMTGSARLGDRIIAQAECVHSNRRMAVMQGTLHNADGKLLATGSATMIFLSEGLKK